jgi:hypothetical protein
MKNILSACFDFGFAMEVDIAFPNFHFLSADFSPDSERHTNFPRNSGK